MLQKAYLVILFSSITLLTVFFLSSIVEASCDDATLDSCGECNIDGNCGSTWKDCIYTGGTDSNTRASCEYSQYDLCSGDPNSCTRALSCDCENPTYQSVSCVSGSFCTGSYGDGCHYCQTPLCNNNGSQDNGETGVDCGGGGCGDCAPSGGGGTTPDPTPAPTPAPTIATSATCNATNTYTGSEVTINWTNTNITRVDIAGDHFSTIESSSYTTNYYSKTVTAGTTAAVAPTGFSKADGSGRTLTLSGNYTYYVRIWNGSSYSSEVSFSITCTAAPCAGYNLYNFPAANASLIYGSTYTFEGWSTFCSGPNGTNRDRVDMYFCPRSSTSLSQCTGRGSIPSEDRPDVENVSWTCGDDNANNDGWYYNWPVTQPVGNYTLKVASINDSATTCVIWANQDISITCPVAGTIPACRTSGGSVPNGSCGTTSYAANCNTSCSGDTCAAPSAPSASPLTCVSTSTYTTNLSWTGTDDIKWVDISSAAGDALRNASYSHKDVSSITVAPFSTIAPIDFNVYLPTPAVTTPFGNFATGTTYWARVSNNSTTNKNSSWASFSRNACPINGGWTTEWDGCTAACAPGGFQYRYCTNPEPDNGGDGCSDITGSGVTNSGSGADKTAWRSCNITTVCSLPWIQVTGDVHSNSEINAPGGP